MGSSTDVLATDETSDERAEGVSSSAAGGGCFIASSGCARMGATTWLHWK